MPRIAPECISETLNLKTFGGTYPARVAKFLIKIITQLSLPLCKDMWGTHTIVHKAGNHTCKNEKGNNNSISDHIPITETIFI